MPRKRLEYFRLLFNHLAWIEHQFLSGIRDSRKAGSLWGMMRGVGGVRKSIHQSWLAKGLGLICWGFKGVQEEIPSEEASTLQSRTMHQFTTPSLSQTIWPRWASRHFLTLPTVQTLLPVTFGYSLSSEAVIMRQLRRWKRLWPRSLTCSHKRTSEVVGMVQVHCSQRRLPWRELEFHVCTINKSAHTKSLETYLMILINIIYIYIYIYIYRERERQTDRQRQTHTILT